MPFSGRVVVQILGELLGSNDLATVDSDIDQKFANVFTNGTGANQANNFFADRRPLTGGTNEDLDLVGVLSSALGAVISTAKLKVIIFRALPANTGNLTITRPAANGVPFLLAAGDGLAPLKPGAFAVITDPSAAGITVTAGTGDLINIAASGAGANNYDVVLVLAE